MKHFLIIVNQQKHKELELTKKIKTYIEDNGGTCTHFVTEVQKEMEADKVLIQTISSSSLLEVCLQLAKNPVYNPINRGGTNAVTFTNTFLLQMFNNLFDKW